MTRRRRILLALAVAAAVAYAAAGAAATVRREQAIRNVFDEMALDGPVARGGLPFPWIRGTMSFPTELRLVPGTWDKWMPEPEVRSETFSYAGDLGNPWDGMEYYSGDRSHASIDIMDDGRVVASCSTRDGMTADGLAFTASFDLSYDPATRTLSWEQYFMTWEPDKEDDSRGWDYNMQFYHNPTREEWLAATGVDGARLDAWVDRALAFGIRGWLSQNAGRTRFSLGDLGDFNLAGNDVGRLRAFLDSLGETT